MADRERDPRDPRDAEDAELAGALRAAFEPAPLDGEEHEAILARALDGAPSEDAELAGALRAAFEPRPIDPDEHEAIVMRALDGAPRAAASDRRRRPRALSVSVTVGVSALALAAGVLIAIGGAPAGGPTGAEAPLARARSTQPLFSRPFKAGETSARIDRIAVARAADYRDNRFAAWGVR